MQLIEVANRVNADLIVLGVHKPWSSNPSPHRYGSSCRRSREMSRLDRSTLSGNCRTWEPSPERSVNVGREHSPENLS
jgi:hypothetical protein